jgi:hydroxyethylthiazole kinase-like sugar kinase family protein
MTLMFTEGRKGMRRLTLVVAAGFALAATSLAVGALQRDRSMSPVTATFTATTVGTRATTACTNGDGTFQIT